jgi:hypothetical protein
VRSDAENRFEACIVCTFVGTDGGDSGEDDDDANADAWEKERSSSPSPSHSGMFSRGGL